MVSGELRIEMLGPLQVTVEGKGVEFRTDAERALLVYLAAHPGAPQRRDTLAGLLSPDRADQEALTYLRNRLTRLRAALGDHATTPPWLEIDRKEIALRTGDDIEIDLIQFEQILGEVEAHAHRRLAGCPVCLARLQEAVDLVRGELLAGLNFPSDMWESWLMAQREHYLQRTLEAMTWLREARLERGEWEALLDVAQRQLTLEPWLEAAHRALMQAHYHLGDRNAALAQYERCQQVLREELGVEPEVETRQLHQRILDSGLVAAGKLDVPDNLPLQTSRFFGRQAEQTRLIHLLVDPTYRLVTLVGPGGIGKTRLALEVGKQVKANFPDGVWFVSLDAIQRDGEQIKIGVGEAAGLRQAGTQLTGDQVFAILRDKQMLLIFDSCEAALDEIGFLPAWLRRAPRLAVLATSREPLNFQAESVVLLDGLATGEGEVGAAEAMFAEQGQMARDAFVMTAENLPQIRRICELVDRLPLGIALAAAWLRRRSLRQISDAIGHSLDFLSTNARDMDPRHRSIRAVFETSWAMLGEAQQTVLAALSVFPTTFSAEAAIAVAGATQFDLDLLCEKSLLQQQYETERYGMHNLVRQFAAEKLTEQTPMVERAFVGHLHRFARAHQAEYARLQPEWRNLLAGVTKAHALGEWATVLDFVRVLDDAWFRQIRFHDMRTGLALAVDAAAALPDEPALARTLLRLGEIETELNDYAAAEAHLAEAMQHLMRLEDTLGIAYAHYFLGRIKLEQARDDEAQEMFAVAKRIFEEEEEWPGVAKTLNVLAICHMKQNTDLQTAQTCLEQSIALQDALPSSSTYVMALRYLARIKSRVGVYRDAENLLSKAALASWELEDMGEYAAVLYEQMVLCKRRAQWDAALGFGYDCLGYFQKLGSLRWEGLVKTQLGILHQAKEQPQHALPLFQEALQIFVEVGDLFEQAYAHYYLYRLYAETNEMAQSLAAKQQAQRLNGTLKIPHLQEQLAQDTL